MHEELEVLFALTGRVNVSAGERHFVLEPEGILVVTPFEAHRLSREWGGHTLSLYVPMGILEQAKLGRISCCSALRQEKAVYLEDLRDKLAALFLEYQDPQSNGLHRLSRVFALLGVLRQGFEEGGGPRAMSLTRHTSHDDRSLSFSRPLAGRQAIRVDVRDKGAVLRLPHAYTASAGYANDLLLEPIQATLRRAVKEVEFPYLFFHGILNQSMNVYHADPDGALRLNFNYVDMVLDFILSTGAAPGCLWTTPRRSWWRGRKTSSETAAWTFRMIWGVGRKSSGRC